jgi:hypothetical protein
VRGACAKRVTIANRLLFACALLGSLASSGFCATDDALLPAEVSFAYAFHHSVTPLPDEVIHRIAGTDITDTGDANAADAFDAPHEAPLDARIAPRPVISRAAVCSTVASVARANDLPVPFFANLIWQESSFNPRTVSHAGAQGIAQFMPDTAKQYGLANPFDPIHALHAAGRFLNKLVAQFGNLGLAAAAYNAGPGRVSEFMAKGRRLPDETKNYVVRITGRPAEKWTSRAFVQAPEAKLMPAKAPCVEVAAAVEAQAEAVRQARLAMPVRETRHAAAGRAEGHRHAANMVRITHQRTQAKAVAATADQKPAHGRVKLAGRIVPEKKASARVKDSSRKTNAPQKRTRVASAR